MKIKKNICLDDLSRFGYKYQENLIYPTYKKAIRQGNSNIIIEILVLDRTIFVNKNKMIKSNHLRYLEDLKRHDFILIEDSDNIKDRFWLRR